MSTSETAPRRSYTESFKKEMAELVETSRKSISQLSRETSIAENNLRKWHKRYIVESKVVPAESEMSTKELVDEVRRLRRTLSERTQEVELLKKATAYFARLPDRHDTHT